MHSPPAAQRPDHYQRVPYPGVADPETQIRGLAALAMLFGIEPAPPAACRVLELGCAAGRNLLPQAAEFPSSEFQGLDAAGDQVAEARGVAAEAGLGNVKLHELDLQQLDASWGQFDYLLCAGVFSWVPEPAQERILAICRQHLAPRGIAVITHNVFPGWHFQAAARDLMRSHVAPLEDPGQQIAAARAILDFVAAHTPAESIQGQVFRRERDYLRTVRDEYLYHDYLVDENRPRYFRDFMEQAQRHGLQLVCDANLAKISGAFLAPEVQQVLANTPLVERCQLLDFLRNESFHKTVLCRAELPVVRTSSAEAVKRLHLILIDIPQPPQFDPTADQPLDLAFPAGKLTTRDPVGKAALLHLIRQRPQPVSLPGLHQAALDQLPAPRDSDRSEAGLTRLSQAMAGAVQAGLVKAYADPPRFVSRPGQRPVVTPLVRAWARRGGLAVNQLHENIQLGTAEAEVAAALDGSRGRDDLVRDFSATLAGSQPPAADRPPAHLEPPARLEQILDVLAEKALLVG